MGLEVSPQYIQDLNASWPLGTESQRQGDDHLRHIKHVLVKQLGSLGTTDLTATAEELNNLVADNSWESAFPVGAIYLTMSTHNPSDFLPGTWGLISEGRFLVGVGSDPDGEVPAYTLGSTGGESKVTLLASELPVHSHPPPGTFSGFQCYKSGGGSYGHGGATGNDTLSQGATGTSGQGNAHENRPPYLACAIWQRLS